MMMVIATQRHQCGVSCVQAPARFGSSLMLHEEEVPPPIFYANADYYYRMI